MRIFLKYKWQKESCREEMRKKRTFRDASGDYIWYESVTNPWVELARDDSETLNWMIQGKCEEKMSQLGLIRKNLDDSETE